MKTNEFEYIGKLPVQLECERLRKPLCCHLSFLQDEHFDAFIKVLENGKENGIDALRTEEEYRKGEYSDVIERYSYDRSKFLKMVREDIELVEDLKEYVQKIFSDIDVLLDLYFPTDDRRICWTDYDIKSLRDHFRFYEAFIFFAAHTKLEPLSGNAPYFIDIICSSMLAFLDEEDLNKQVNLMMLGLSKSNERISRSMKTMTIMIAICTVMTTVCSVVSLIIALAALFN